MAIFPFSPPPVNKAAWDSLPPEVRDRLAAEGIKTPQDWRTLSPARRRALFGIVPSMRRRIDAVAQL
jgi:hypothetical protein